MDKLKIAFLVVVVICMVGAWLKSCSRPFNKVANRRDITTTVTDKEVKNSSDESKYLVYTKDENEDIQVLEITDSLFVGQFNSSDLYAGIEVGKTYVFDIGGSRKKLLSWYPNIYGYEEVKTTKSEN